MTPPIYQDDALIRDGERLFRRVHLTQLVKDEDTGLARVSSGAFKDKELSVNIESVLANAGNTAEACLQSHKAHKLISITAGNARQFNQAVCRDPLLGDPSHGLVCGSKNRSSIHDGLRAAAAWVIPPIAPPYDEIEAEKRAQGIKA
jgi:hypothetical protein